MEDALRALQQRVNALQSQNAVLDTQLRRQLNIARGIAELPGAIRTVLNRAQAPTRRMLVDQVGPRKFKNNVSGVFPNVNTFHVYHHPKRRKQRRQHHPTGENGEGRKKGTNPRPREIKL